ncbi:MAG: ComEC/Rec2 family competence protein, partial [Bacteroidales bacterium]
MLWYVHGNTYRKFRYGVHVYFAGLSALFLLGALNASIVSVPSVASVVSSPSVPSAPSVAPYHTDHGAASGTSAGLGPGSSAGLDCSDLPNGVYVKLCLKVTDYPVRVTSAAGRVYNRMECRLLFFADTAGRLCHGSEKVLAYLAAGPAVRKSITNSTSGVSGITLGITLGVPDTSTFAADTVLWRPGDVFFTRCRTFSFEQPEPEKDTVEGKVADSGAADSFNYARYMAQRGFYRRAYVYSVQRVGQEPRLADKIKWLRADMTRNFKGEAGALLSGICLGYKAQMDRGTRENFTNTGVAHVLAVSGLHVGVLYATLLFLLGLPARWKVERRYRRKTRSRFRQKAGKRTDLRNGNAPGPETDLISESKVDPVFGRKVTGRVQVGADCRMEAVVPVGRGRYVAALALIWVYAAIVGFSASVVRAATMLTVHGVGKMLGCRSSGLNALAVSALIMLIIKPMNLMDAGFQLSYCAVASLLILFPLLRNILSPKNQILKYLWEMLCVTVTVQIGTVWLVYLIFGRVTFWGLLLNFAVVPLCSLILYAFTGYVAFYG